MKKLHFKSFMPLVFLLMAAPVIRGADQTTIDGITLTEIWKYSNQSGNFNGAGWLSANTRDLAFWNGELIVVGSSGSVPTLVRVDVRTGKKIADMSVKNVTGGSIPLSSIVVVKGKLYGCNLSSPFKIYRWDTPTSDPVVAYTKATISEGTNALGRKMGCTADMIVLSNSSHLYKFNVADNGALTTAAPIQFSTPISNGGSDGTSVSIVSAQSTNALRVWCFSPYSTHIIKGLDGTGVGSINVSGTALTAPVQGSSGQVIKFNNKKILAVVDYNVAGSFKQGQLKLLSNSGVSDLAYTYNGNKLPARPFDETDNVNTSVITSVEYQISSDGKTLDIACLVPQQGVALFSTLPSFSLPKDMSAGNAVWDGDNQKVTLAWTPGNGLKNYVLSYAREADDTQWATVNDNISVATGSITVTLPRNLGYAPLYRLQSINSGGAQEGASLYARAYNAPFGTMELTAVNQDGKTRMQWNAPKNGVVNNYSVMLVKRITHQDGTTSAGEELKFTTTATSYDYPDFMLTYTEGTDNISASLKVVANMSQTLALKSGVTSKVESNTATPSIMGRPYFTEVRTYTGRNIVSLKWDMQGVHTDVAHHKSYDMYRDGVLIFKNFRASSVVDMEIPVGTHLYYVVCNFIDSNGNKLEPYVGLTSDAVEVTVSRLDDVEQYGLEEIYNYPIMTQDQYEAQGGPGNAVVATGCFVNAKDKVGAGGAPGDIWRQAVYRDGYWYLSRLTDARPGKGADNVTPNPSFEQMTKDNYGGVYRLDANDPRKVSDMRLMFKTYGWENQSVAVDHNKTNVNIFCRRAEPAISANNPTYANPWGQGSTWNAALVRMRYFSPVDHVYTGQYAKDVAIDNNNRPDKYIDIRNATKNSGGNTWWDEYLKWDIGARGYNGTDAGKTNPVDVITQYYRCHYMAAGGDMQAGTAYLRFAPSYTNESYYVAFDKDGKIIDSKRYVATFGDGTPADGSGSSECRAYPVVGKDHAFIHCLRGVGLFYVNYGAYTTISTDESDVTALGGTTFMFHDKLFFLHGVTTQSNNPGNFRVELCSNGDFTNLIPIGAIHQNDEASFENQGNSNANWYGAEYDENEDCIYIYQYVPGVRFAKYKLYSLKEFPPVQPVLEINVRTEKLADGTGDEITDFDAVTTWQHPVNFYGLSENATYSVAYYVYQLFDNNNKLITGARVENAVDENNVETYTYIQPWCEKYNQRINNRTVTTSVIPVYKNNTSGTLYRGENGMAINNNDYPASIGGISARAYKGVDAAGLWRVDINFDRAVMTDDQYPLPVNYFTIETAPSAEGPWTRLEGYRYFWKDGFVGHSDQPAEVGNYINALPGDYIFGVEGEPQNLKTRFHYNNQRGAVDFTSYKAKAAADANDVCVAYHYTDTDPTGKYYRAVAHYAANNAFIAKDIPTMAVAAIDNGVSGAADFGIGTQVRPDVYPVPATTVVTVEFPREINSIRVVSLSGVTLLSEQGNGLTMQRVDVSALAPGFYMLQVNDMAPVRIVKK